MSRRYSIPVCAALAACTTVAEPRADGWAALGQATRAGSLAIIPVELVEDSRCPAGTQCVWEGRVVVRARVENGASRPVDLVLGEEIRAADGLLELDRVEPAAIRDVEIPLEDYRFHFRHAPMIMGR